MHDTQSFGLVRIGTIDLALPCECIEEILDGPLEVGEFPQAPLHVLGAFHWRGLAIPLVDLATIIQPAATARPLRPIAYALVLRHQLGRIAVQVDAVLGVVRAAPSRITQLDTQAPDGCRLFTEALVPEKGGRVAVLLDLGALLSTEGVRSATGPSGLGESRQGAADDGEASFHVFFRSSGACFGLNSTFVSMALPFTEALDSPLNHPILMGVHKLRGRDYPVLDLRRLLDLSAKGNGSETRYLLVVDDGARAAALCVDELVAVERIEGNRLRGAPDSAGHNAALLQASVLRRSGEAALVLDPAALLGNEAVIAPETFLTNNGGEARFEGARQATENAAPEQFLIYRSAGRSLATAVTELECVKELPAGFCCISSEGGSFIGLSAHGEEPIRLLDLSLLMGATATALDQPRPILCVRREGALIGYVVEATEFMCSSTPLPLPGRDDRTHGEIPPFTRMLRLRTGDTPRALCILSLGSLSPEPAQEPVQAS